MKRQRLLALPGKSPTTIVRQPASLFMAIMFPLVLTFVFGASFGGMGGGQEATSRVGVVNLDRWEGGESWARDFMGNMSCVEALDMSSYPTMQRASRTSPKATSRA